MSQKAVRRKRGSVPTPNSAESKVKTSKPGFKLDVPKDPDMQRKMSELIKFLRTPVIPKQVEFEDEEEAEQSEDSMEEELESTTSFEISTIREDIERLNSDLTKAKLLTADLQKQTDAALMRKVDLVTWNQQNEAMEKNYKELKDTQTEDIAELDKRLKVIETTEGRYATLIKGYKTELLKSASDLKEQVAQMKEQYILTLQKNTEINTITAFSNTVNDYSGKLDEINGQLATQKKALEKANTKYSLDNTALTNDFTVYVNNVALAIKESLEASITEVERRNEERFQTWASTMEKRMITMESKVDTLINQSQNHTQEVVSLKAELTGLKNTKPMNNLGGGSSEVLIQAVYSTIPEYSGLSKDTKLFVNQFRFFFDHQAKNLTDKEKLLFLRAKLITNFEDWYKCYSKEIATPDELLDKLEEDMTIEKDDLVKFKS